jgi:hypothetical protein
VSHHLDAPGLQPPNFDPAVAATHITDFYVFRSPSDPGSTALVLNVNPLALAPQFDPEAVYEVLVDSDGDARADVVFQVTFDQPDAARRQLATVRRTGAPNGAPGTDGEVLFGGAPVSLSPESEASIAGSGEYRFFAGIRSDPFFADVEGVQHGFRFTGSDFFADKNVFSIVLEVPNRALGEDPRVGLWARVLAQRNGHWVQLDRVGHPAVDAAFNVDEPDRPYNLIDPAQDRARYLGKFVAVLEQGGHYSSQEATTIARRLLPDILPYDYSAADGATEGRTLEVDSADAILALVTHDFVTTDLVGPHTDLLRDFPYLGKPHQ